MSSDTPFLEGKVVGESLDMRRAGEAPLRLGLCLLHLLLFIDAYDSVSRQRDVTGGHSARGLPGARHWTEGCHRAARQGGPSKCALLALRGGSSGADEGITCGGCGRSLPRKVVMKESPNKGRGFYSCSGQVRLFSTRPDSGYLWPPVSSGRELDSHAADLPAHSPDPYITVLTHPRARRAAGARMQALLPVGERRQARFTVLRLGSLSIFSTRSWRSWHGVIAGSSRKRDGLPAITTTRWHNAFARHRRNASWCLSTRTTSGGASGTARRRGTVSISSTFP
jgi:hypothetical protein